MADAGGRDPLRGHRNVTGASVPFAPQERWSAGNALQRRGFSERALATTMKVMHLVVSSRPLIQSGILPVGDLYLWFDALDPYQDPLQDWRQVEQPAFIGYGAQDDTVPSKESAEVIERILAENGHPLSRLVVYPTAGHGIRLATGEWAPGHIETMTGWLKATLDGQPTPTTPGQTFPSAGFYRSWPWSAWGWQPG